MASLSVGVVPFTERHHQDLASDRPSELVWQPRRESRVAAVNCLSADVHQRSDVVLIVMRTSCCDGGVPVGVTFVVVAGSDSWMTGCYCYFGCVGPDPL